MSILVTGWDGRDAYCEEMDGGSRYCTAVVTWQRREMDRDGSSLGLGMVGKKRDRV